MSGHFRHECSHGKVVRQCRCMGEHTKAITIVPCGPPCMGGAPLRKSVGEQAADKLAEHVEEELSLAQAAVTFAVTSLQKLGEQQERVTELEGILERLREETVSLNDYEALELKLSQANADLERSRREADRS